jgi:hypothetical protein
MLPLTVAAAIAGAVIAGRSGPKTRFQKLKCLGPHSGMVYEVDFVPSLGVAIVHALDGTMGLFQQNQPPKGGFSFVRGQGTERVVEAMRRDLEGAPVVDPSRSILDGAKPKPRAEI